MIKPVRDLVATSDKVDWPIDALIAWLQDCRAKVPAESLPTATVYLVSEGDFEEAGIEVSYRRPQTPEEAVAEEELERLEVLRANAKSAYLDADEAVKRHRARSGMDEEDNPTHDRD